MRPEPRVETRQQADAIADLFLAQVGLAAACTAYAAVEDANIPGWSGQTTHSSTRVTAASSRRTSATPTSTNLFKLHPYGAPADRHVLCADLLRKLLELVFRLHERGRGGALRIQGRNVLLSANDDVFLVDFSESLPWRSEDANHLIGPGHEAPSAVPSECDGPEPQSHGTVADVWQARTGTFIVKEIGKRLVDRTEERARYAEYVTRSPAAA